VISDARDSDELKPRSVIPAVVEVVAAASICFFSSVVVTTTATTCFPQKIQVELSPPTPFKVATHGGGREDQAALEIAYVLFIDIVGYSKLLIKDS
jgi:hypothetical protein